MIQETRLFNTAYYTIVKPIVLLVESREKYIDLVKKSKQQKFYGSFYSQQYNNQCKMLHLCMNSVGW